MHPKVTFLPAPSTCLYLPEQQWQLRYELDGDITQAAYMFRLKSGWRRFGPFLFRPECPECRRCQSLRVAVEAFRPNESQRRAWRGDAGEVTLRIDTPSITPEKQKLFADFHRHGHETKGWPLDGHADLGLLLMNPVSTEEWSYFIGDRLIGVGYVDALPEGLSAIYFYWDPVEAKRSLGTFNILKMIEIARQRHLPHVYLGYHVDGCRSLEYKARFRPNEVLGQDGKWTEFGTDGPHCYDSARDVDMVNVRPTGE